MKPLLPCLALALGAPLLAGERVHLDDPGLDLELPALEGLAASSVPEGDVVASWSGGLEGSDVSVRVASLDRVRLGCVEPEDVTALVQDFHEQRLREQGRGADFGERAVVEGAFGWATYASLARAELREADALVDGRLWLLCGVGERRAWVVEVEALPLTPAADKAIERFLRKGVSAPGAPRECRWSDEEARARWEEFAPEDARDKFEEPLRTAHYIILTNSSGGKLFGKKMEECYDTIQELFPFPEVEGRKLMPVFLFRTPDQYFQYYANIAGVPVEQARRSKGHAWRDYYATWYEAPKDPVHIHEATHQIFANRLVLGGGGSWFQEGVAEYVETRANERNNAARLVKKRRHTPLREFVQIESLLMSAGEDKKGGNEAGDHYKQAALLIEFLRESRFAKAGFPRFVDAVGRVPRGDVEAIEAVVRRVWAVGLEELEDAWVEYCQKR